MLLKLLQYMDVAFEGLQYPTIVNTALQFLKWCVPVPYIQLLQKIEIQ